MLSRSFAGIVVFGMALLVPIPTEACSTLVYDHHGPILPSPAVSFIYLQDGNSYWASAEGQAELRAYNAWGNVLSTKAFWSRLREYQIGTGYYASGNNAVINTPPPSSGYLQDYDIAQILEGYFVTHATPPNTGRGVGNANYVLFLPPTIASAVHHRIGAETAFHSSYYSNWAGENITYSIVEYHNPETQLAFGFEDISHEIAEAVTDPLGSGYLDPSGNEIGDLCSGGGNIQTHDVQPIWSQVACSCVLKRNVLLDDFDGDQISDLAYWHPADGTWRVYDAVNNGYIVQQWGLSTDTPLVADFDGDWIADFAVWRSRDPYRGNVSDIIIKLSSNGATRAVAIGSAGDVPVPADYDGDGIADPATWTPSTGVWHVLWSSTGALVQTQWGTNGDRPVPADFDGDGRADIAVWRPSDPSSGGASAFIVTMSQSGQVVRFRYGLPNDLPTPGDYDGDGLEDFSTYRPSTATFAFWPTSTNGPSGHVTLGVAGGNEIPMPRRWTATNPMTGRTAPDSFAVRDNSSATFYWSPASPFGTSLFRGSPGDIPAH